MDLHTHIHHALLEDAAFHDLTAMATIDAQQHGTASITAKAHGILSGTGAAQEVAAQVDGAIQIQWHKHDGDVLHVSDHVCTLQGPMRGLLAAERTLLNYLQHLSGIASSTRQYVDAVQGFNCQIMDTRKTTPGLRILEKQAVLHGGGCNHRLDLSAGMLIKENHITACGSIADAIAACRAMQRKHHQAWVEVECETLQEVEKAASAQPDIILLDNMDVPTIQTARSMIPANIIAEASGGITLDNIRAYAATGVDRIAVGFITHSAPALDLSMRVQ